MEEISTDAAPPSIGPFSQGIRDGDRIYVSGQGPVDPESGEIVGDTIEEQTARTLENVDAVLQTAGRSLDDVVKATVFVQDMDDYDAINEVYADTYRRRIPPEAPSRWPTSRSTSASKSRSSRAPARRSEAT